jgi:HAE1 family hydrophobic/amphiphilic exporter-1
MNLASFAIKKPITTVVILASIVVLGAIAATRMKLAYLPSVDFPVVMIRVDYPNSSPSQIEKNIVKPIEEALSTMSGIKNMNSRSTADGAEIELEFDWGLKLDLIRTEIGEKVEMVRPELPPDVEHINIFNFSSNDIPVVQARVSAPGIDLASNYDLLEKKIKVPIQRIAGVARVDLEGVNPKVIYVDLILNKIREHNIDIGRLAELLQKNGANVSVGKIRNEDNVITVRSLGNYPDFGALENLPVNDHGLRLRDVAEISYQEPALEFGRHLDHSFAVAVQVYKEPTANTVEVASQVTKLIKEDFPKDPDLKGISLFVWEDQAAEITNGLTGITEGGLWGGLFALVILYVFLRRMDMTLVVSLAIPISLLCGTAALYYLGMTFNVMSMMGLMLAVGMLVDDAVVVLESIYKCRQEGMHKLEASEKGSNTVAMAVTMSTITTIIVFLPLIVGKKTNITTFLAEIGMAITVSLLCSLFLSLTLIPLVTSRYLREKEAPEAKIITWMRHKYVASLAWTFRHRWLTAAIAIVLMASVYLPIQHIQKGIFAGGKNKRQHVEYEFSDFTYKSDVEDIVTKVEKFLETKKKEYPMESIYSFFSDSNAMTVVTFKRDDVTAEEAKAFREKLRKEMPKFGGVKIYFEDEDEEAGGDTRFFSVYLYGEDIEQLKLLSRDAESRLAKLKGIEDLRVDSDTGRGEVQMVLNREKAMKAGVTPQDLSQIQMFTLGGQRLPRYTTSEKEIDMVLGLRIEDRANIEDLKNLQIGSPNGPVALRTFVDFYTVEGQNQLERQNRKNFVSLKALFEGSGKDWEKMKESITAQMNTMKLPAGYSWSWDRRVQQGDEDSKVMMINFLLALALVYIVMASLFESLIHPLAIIISIPFALVGVFWLLWITSTPFNLMAQIGLLILIGVVVRNGIVLIDRVHQLRESGVARMDALLQAGNDRLRPILMTAATTILGLVPLAIGSSALLGLSYYPLARAVIGGLAASTVLTLIILPFVYTLFDDAAAWARRVWLTSETKALGELPAEAAAGD